MLSHGAVSPRLWAGSRLRSVITHFLTIGFTEAGLPGNGGGWAVRRRHHPQLQIWGGGLCSWLHRMLQRLWRQQWPRLPKHTRTKVQNSSRRVQEDMNNELWKRMVFTLHCTGCWGARDLNARHASEHKREKNKQVTKVCVPFSVVALKLLLCFFFGLFVFFAAFWFKEKVLH